MTWLDSPCCDDPDAFDLLAFDGGRAVQLVELRKEAGKYIATAMPILGGDVHRKSTVRVDADFFAEPDRRYRSLETVRDANGRISHVVAFAAGGIPVTIKTAHRDSDGKIVRTEEIDVPQNVQRSMGFKKIMELPAIQKQRDAAIAMG